MAKPTASQPPLIVVLAGPNGAGKSTAAEYLLRDALAVSEFVNADVIARGLSGFDPESMAVAAGRLMLARLDELASQRARFAFETTLSSRGFAPWLRKRGAEGFEFHLAFLWLPAADVAIGRVANRVRTGGHYVPDEVVRRRYAGGLHNFFALYRPIATGWRMYDSSARGEPRLIAGGEQGQETEIGDAPLWERIVREWNAT